MPYCNNSTYTAPVWLVGGHVQTIYPSLTRRVPRVPFQRSRLNTPDNDFILLDWITAGPAAGRDVVILSHGLEGNSRRTYMRGMARVFLDAGWDCISRNCRGCCGEMNNKPAMYHSGQTEDLHTVVRHAVELGYERIFLIGFSMGGNQTLKYLGEDPAKVPDEVTGGAVFSVPCDLTGCSLELEKPGNIIYMEYFMRTLRRKVLKKHERYPELFPLNGLSRMRTFREFDNQYTAPLFGFDSAEDYWAKASSLPFLEKIEKPVLLVNAANDPFLSPSCYPRDMAEQSASLFLEVPEDGGHMGFPPGPGRELYWTEDRALAFAREVTSNQASI